MKEFTAEVIAIGDEMTSGAKLDTNTQWLCQRLGEIGITVRFTSMVGDQLSDNFAVFRNAANRVDFVVATGGLGPTADDLTREVIAAVAGKPLVLHEPSLRHIESLFASRAREMPPRNRVQAMFPEGAFDIFNPRGTAPGIDMTVARLDGGSCRFFALPGVPAEMKEMFGAVVAPRILASLGSERPLIRTAVVKCFGIGESDMEARLGEMISRQSSPRVGITVSAATISLRITVAGKTEEECSGSIDQVRREIKAKAGEYVYGEGEDFELHDAVMQLLEPRNQRLATIELGHAAPLANWLADSLPRHLYAGGMVAENASVRRRRDSGLATKVPSRLVAHCRLVPVAEAQPR
jgi:nicotinamide-nucleotide amidase